MKRLFKYKNRWVIGYKPYTWQQRVKVLLPIGLWTLTVFYVIIRNAICDCLYLTVVTQWPVIIISLFCLLWTYFVRKDTNHKNYIYEPSVKLEIP